MPCDDCASYPMCVNYPDGTWKTVYNEAQEEKAKTYKSAKDIDCNIEQVIKQANALVSKGISEKVELKKFGAQINQKPMDASINTLFNTTRKAPCKNC